MAFRAKLDHDRVYWGVEEVEELAEGDVAVPADCDLKPGAYQWVLEPGRFEPLPKTQVKAEPGAPSLEEAFYAYLEQGAQGAPVVAWRTWFKQTMDNRGAK